MSRFLPILYLDHFYFVHETSCLLPGGFADILRRSEFRILPAPLNGFFPTLKHCLAVLTEAAANSSSHLFGAFSALARTHPSSEWARLSYPAVVSKVVRVPRV